MLNGIKDSISGALETTLLVPIVVLIVGTLVHTALIWRNNSHSPQENFGGPTPHNTWEYQLRAASLEDGVHLYINDTLPQDNEELNLPLPDHGAFAPGAGPSLGNAAPYDGVIRYTIARGDTLSTIATKFGVTVRALEATNKYLRGNALRVGGILTVLPVPGVVHIIESNSEDLRTIAAMYGVPEARIRAYNKTAMLTGLTVGTELLIPETPREYLTTDISKLPEHKGYFALPAAGRNWGKLHDYNAVDIANNCGTPIYAAAAGTVIESFDTGAWNGGYGNYLLIEHTNGARTRYAHNERNAIRTGAYVLQGDLIAYIGNTGNAHGPTGCHLHFEIIGARNTFGK